METEDTLYIRILVWAYKRQETGFSWKELMDEFKLNKKQEQWVIKIFRSNMPIVDNLIDHLSYNEKNNEHLYVITAKGTSAAVQYLNLKEAEISGKRAEKIAKVAIVIGIIVGITQITIELLQLYAKT